ncbi:MAG: hypothetical protein ACRDOI_13710, partial [Trebonia sp.]
MNSSPAVFAVDHGSCTVTFTVLLSPAGVVGAATARHGGQLPVHGPPGGLLLPCDLAGAAAGQAARRQRTDQA